MAKGGELDLPDNLDLRRDSDATMQKTADQFILEIADKGLPTSGQSFSIGQIRHIDIPSNWKQKQTSDNLDTSVGNFTAFQSDKNKDSLLCFYSRGGAMDDAAAKAFTDLLSRPVHQLTEAELNNLKPILRERLPGENFAVTQANTQVIDGRKVLYVEGRHTNADLNVAALYIDAKGDGRFVQEVYYQAQSRAYLADRPQAMEAFKSLRLNGNPKIERANIAPDEPLQTNRPKW